jgi:hypothetical protein
MVPKGAPNLVVGYNINLVLGASNEGGARDLISNTQYPRHRYCFREKKVH